MIQGPSLLFWLGNFTSWVTNSSPSGVKLVETMWLFIKNVRSSHMCGLKFMFTFPNRNSRIRSKNYISSKFVNREWRQIKGLWMMMPGSLALVWCIPLSPATWKYYFSFQLQRKQRTTSFFSFRSLTTFSFQFQENLMKKSPHPTHRWTPQNNVDFHHCRRAYHIIFYHVVCNYVL